MSRQKGLKLERELSKLKVVVIVKRRFFSKFFSSVIQPALKLSQTDCPTAPEAFLVHLLKCIGISSAFLFFSSRSWKMAATSDIVLFFCFWGSCAFLY